MSLPAISKHLKVLERAGLIARGREAQWRPCRLEARPLKPRRLAGALPRHSGSKASIGWKSICEGAARQGEAACSQKLNRHKKRRTRACHIARIIDAPRSLLFRHGRTRTCRAVVGPQGFITIHCDMDIRQGGAFRSACVRRRGSEHWKSASIVKSSLRSASSSPSPGKTLMAPSGTRTPHHGDVRRTRCEDG